MIFVMTFPDWNEPVRLLEEQSGPATMEQLKLAAQVAFPLDGDLPRGVAAVLLEEHFRPRIWGVPRREDAPATQRQREFLEAIAHDRSFEGASLSKGVASAWITHYLGIRNAERLRELGLTAGDQVVHQQTWVDHSTGELHNWSDRHVVSRIGARGLVYFKGGNGRCGWPTNLSRCDDASSPLPRGTTVQETPESCVLADRQERSLAVAFRG